MPRKSKNFQSLVGIIAKAEGRDIVATAELLSTLSDVLLHDPEYLSALINNGARRAKLVSKSVVNDPMIDDIKSSIKRG